MQALVLDDSRAIRVILRGMLKDLGFTVVEAGHGREGLERLRELKDSVDIALVDWNMPEMNGYEFLVAVRADHRFDKIPVVMVTSESESAQIAKALDAGANEYIMKPFTKDVILGKLEMLGFTAA